MWSWIWWTTSFAFKANHPPVSVRHAADRALVDADDGRDARVQSSGGAALGMSGSSSRPQCPPDSSSPVSQRHGSGADLPGTTSRSWGASDERVHDGVPVASEIGGDLGHRAAMAAHLESRPSACSVEHCAAPVVGAHMRAASVPRRGRRSSMTSNITENGRAPATHPGSTPPTDPNAISPPHFHHCDCPKVNLNRCCGRISSPVSSIEATSKHESEYRS